MKLWGEESGANRTIVSYDAISAVRIYNAMSSLVYFNNKKFFFEKRSSLLQGRMLKL
jgi:hypothetical protein